MKTLILAKINKMKTVEYEGVSFKIGKNSAENWDLLGEDQNYIWFHLASYPSCYVICCEEDPSNEIITYGAQLCKENTKYRNLKNLRVNYTKLSNLKKAETVGSVYIKSNRKVKNIVI